MKEDYSKHISTAIKPFKDFMLDNNNLTNEEKLKLIELYQQFTHDTFVYIHSRLYNKNPGTIDELMFPMINYIEKLVRLNRFTKNQISKIIQIIHSQVTLCLMIFSGVARTELVKIKIARKWEDELK